MYRNSSSKASPASLNHFFLHLLPQALNAEHWWYGKVICRMNWYLLGVDETHTLQPSCEEGLWAQDTLTPLRQHVLQLWVCWQSSWHHWELVSALLEDESRWEFLNTLNYNQLQYGKVMVKTKHFYSILLIFWGGKRYQGCYS